MGIEYLFISSFMVKVAKPSSSSSSSSSNSSSSSKSSSSSSSKSSTLALAKVAPPISSSMTKSTKKARSSVATSTKAAKSTKRRPNPSGGKPNFSVEYAKRNTKCRLICCPYGGVIKAGQPRLVHKWYNRGFGRYVHEYRHL